MADQHIYSPETIIKAYSLGLFPMADSHDSLEIKFYDPDQRALIPIDNACAACVPAASTPGCQPYTVTINRTSLSSTCATGPTRTWINRIFADSRAPWGCIQSKSGWTRHW